MHISMRQIRIFDAVSRYESHTRAAEQLHMTQPAVSMQMKQLERALDISLFEKHGKLLVLSVAGLALREYCQDIIQSYNNMLDHVEKFKGCQQGHLTVSVTSPANYFATRILSAFSRKFPEVTISLDVTNRQRILLQLDNYEPDIVIMGEPPKGRGLKSERLMPNPLMLIAPPNHPLRAKKNLTMKDVCKEEFVMREKGSGTRESIEHHFAKCGMHCETKLEMSSNEAIKHAVSAGFGLGIVSLHTIRLELQDNLFVALDVEGFPLQRYWHVVTRSGKAMSPIAQAFNDYLRDEAEYYVKPKGLK